jgi:hypothetical protein
MNAGNVHERAEARVFIMLDQARRKAARLRNKLLLSEDLAASAQHTFFCEVLSDHPDARRRHADFGADPRLCSDQCAKSLQSMPPALQRFGELRDQENHRI